MVQIPSPQPKRRGTLLGASSFWLRGRLAPRALRAMRPTSVARWGSAPSAACGGCSEGVRVAAVEILGAEKRDRKISGTATGRKKNPEAFLQAVSPEARGRKADSSAAPTDMRRRLAPQAITRRSFRKSHAIANRKNGSLRTGEAIAR